MPSSTRSDRFPAGGIIRDPASRRGLLTGAGRALAAGSAAFLTACGGEDRHGATAEDRDLGILGHALRLELAAIAAYRQLMGALRGEALATAEAFLTQEQEHADALTKAIKQRGGSAPPAAPAALERPRIASRKEALGFAADLEQVLIAAYLAAVPMLSASDVRAVAGEIAAVEAEHLAVLSGELGRFQVPDAFVSGDPDALAPAAAGSG